MRVFVTGHKGHVGQALLKAGFFPLDCDVTSPDEIVRSIQECKPNLVLHLASKSDVDYCEKPENERKVIRVNYTGTRNVFEALLQFRVPGVLFSTDQIWRGGLFEGNYKEYSKLSPPVNYYGQTKLAAELAARECKGKIIRTSYLFDEDRLSSKICALSDGVTIEEPTFIKRSFLHIPDFVNMISHYCKNFHHMPTVLHISGGQIASWYGFMRELAKVYGFKKSQVKPKWFDSKKYAPRPHNGGLDVGKSLSLGFLYRDFQTGLRRMKNEG